MTGTSEILVPVAWHTCQFTGASWLAPATGTRKLVSVYGPLSFTVEFLSFFFYPTTALSTRGEAGQQMYTRGSVIGAATTNDPDISSTPPLIFTGGGSKSAISGIIAQQRSTLSRCGLETEQDISTILIFLCSDYLTTSPPNSV